jgi:alkanesulfonate monooxygenase SsuD/methylene tetrahydromethanopterin reductase-like flavin-dependent oxidoreductase (luciferase family)
MPDMTAPIKLGANCWNQYTDWASWLSAQHRAERLGYDSLWTWDHLYPIVGSWQGPILEAYTAISALAATTSTVGLMVGANTMRNPALTAKMMTTIDNISDGRAILGIGAAWFETEHIGFGIPFGDGPPERLRWLAQALPIMRGMLDGSEPTVTEGIYRTHAVRNDPPPVQQHLPILIGGSGPQVTLKLVARYGDACNLGGTVASLPEKEAALLEHCATVGRDEHEIERTFGIGVPMIRDSRAEATRVHADIFRRNGDAPVWQEQLVGTSEDLVEMLSPLVEMGYRHIICGFPAPYDEETMTRLATEVRPKLEVIVARG